MVVLFTQLDFLNVCKSLCGPNKTVSVHDLMVYLIMWLHVPCGNLKPMFHQVFFSVFNFYGNVNSAPPAPHLPPICAGSHNVAPGDSIKLITPSSCSCPHFVYPEGSETGDSIFLLSSDVEKLVNRKGQAV